MTRQHTQRAVRLAEGWLPRDLEVHGPQLDLEVHRPQQMIFLDIMREFPLYISHCVKSILEITIKKK